MVCVVLFDLDGTLLNTLHDLHASVNHALQSHGFPSRTLAEIRAFLGNGIRNLISSSLPKDHSEETCAKVLESFKIHYFQHQATFTQPYEGILALLQGLQERGIKMGIVSNKVDSAVQALTKTFFSTYIQLALGETERWGRKPSPAGIHYLLERLGEKPEHCIYVGDSEVDHGTARAAGVKSVLALWGFRDEVDLRPLKADAYLEQPDVLLHWLDTNQL